MGRRLKAANMDNNRIFRVYLDRTYPTKGAKMEFYDRVCEAIKCKRHVITRWRAITRPLSDEEARALEIAERRQIFSDPELRYIAGVGTFDDAINAIGGA